MIISCPKCNKKFEINDDLIPNQGRLLQCGSCNNRWHFSKSLDIEIVDSELRNRPLFEEITEQNEIIYSEIEIDRNEKKIPIKNETILENSDTKINILSLTIVFIITLISLIIILDTFKSPLGLIIPDIEFLLYNLYETFKDITLFFKDLL